MKNNNKKARMNSQREALRRESVNERIRFAAAHDVDEVYEKLKTSRAGLTDADVERARDEYGENTVTHGKQDSLLKRIVEAFVNPFTIILFALAAVSAVTDIFMPPPSEKDPVTVIIIAVMVGISGVLRFVQETRSGNAAARLSAMIKTTTNVQRKDAGRNEIPLDEVVVGDIVYLAAGDMIPADMRIVYAKDLFVSQSALTGESEPVEKYADTYTKDGAITEDPNIAFMGTNVISGSAAGVVVATGNDTLLGEMAKQLGQKPPPTSFEKGVNAVSWVLIRFMLVMVPVVLFINGFTKGDWMHATLFAISVAVGLTPEMLPMIVTTCLAKGAVAMGKQKVIIKNLNAIQNLGAMDILCTDKTGTITQDKVILEYHLDVMGNEDVRVLRHAFLNSYYQTGLRNLMDRAIIDRTMLEKENEQSLENIEYRYQKVDEIPFDFERRRMSVVVEDADGKRQLITKGAVEEMLLSCSYVEYRGEVAPLTDELRQVALQKADELNEDGMRVLALAHKTEPAQPGAFSPADETDMVLIGYLAFLDPPKESTAAAIAALRDHGVSVKVLTGDNEKVTRHVCRAVGLPVNDIMLGDEVDALSDEQLTARAEQITVFAKLSPAQKSRIVTLLRGAGHSVGFMGDGINDAAAMQASDVGISVDTAVDIAKESADVILLEKDLRVLEHGIIEGRKTYANMIKYIKMTASSNFGNMFSVLAASAFLPFLPMESLHLLLLNLIYDVSCTTIPWDNVDAEYLKKPRQWDAGSVSKFMLWIGPTSSVFDIATYLLMFFVVCPAALGMPWRAITDPAMKVQFIALFQTGWFIESMWTQSLVIHMIRTPKIPFIQSRASAGVTLSTLAGIAIATAIPFTPLGPLLGFAALPGSYFAWLGAIVIGYMLLVTLVKKLYVRRFGELL